MSNGLYLISFNRISGCEGFPFNLINSNGYNMPQNIESYGLLINNGGTVRNYFSGIYTDTLTWICRMAGYSYYYRKTTKSYSWMQSFPVKYQNLRCSGVVVPHCRYTQDASTSYDKAMWIYCRKRSSYGDTTSFYLVDSSGSTTQQGYGLLMYNKGTVSGNKFDDSTAELICNIMGFVSVMDWGVGRRYAFQTSSKHIALNNINCITKDRAFPLCSYGTDTTHNSHNEDVWLWCDKPGTSNLVCPPGQRKSSSSNCYECQTNTYSLDPNVSTYCTSCPAYSTSLPGATRCSCKKDYYMNFAGTQCLSCPNKSTSEAGSNFCRCSAGSYLSADYSRCVPCLSGILVNKTVYRLLIV